MQKISPVVVMLSNYLPEFCFPMLRKQNKLHKEMCAELAKVINERRELAKTTAPELLPLDLLSLIVNAKDEQGGVMTLDEIVNQALGIFNSYETTSTAMSWAIYEMLMNPTVEEKLHTELTKHKDIIRNRAPTADELREFSYLGLVVDEILRKYSIIPIVDRIATTDTTLDGMFVPQGTMLLLFPYGVHQNAEHWPKPNEFLPERHVESSTEPKRAPLTMMPFSFGQRNCIGKEFAVLQMQSLLAQILIRYKFTFVPNHPPVGLGYASSVHKPNIDIMLNVHPR
jgi:cytochrome P450